MPPHNINQSELLNSNTLTLSSSVSNGLLDQLLQEESLLNLTRRRSSFALFDSSIQSQPSSETSEIHLLDKELFDNSNNNGINTGTTTTEVDNNNDESALNKLEVAPEVSSQSQSPDGVTTTTNGVRHRHRLTKSPSYDCHHSHLPPWLQDNDFLQSNHRPPLNSYIDCLKSIFSLHSETGNIWSHLIGLKIYLSLAFSFWQSETKDISSEEKWVFSTFFLGVIICMGFSTLFHTFCCHSKSISGLFIKLDYCGISILISGGFFPWIYYGFYCEAGLRQFYTGLSFVMGAISLAASLSPMMCQAKNRPLRTIIFTTCGGINIIPAIHFLLLNNGLGNDPIATRSFIWLSRVTIICFIKAGIYAWRIPERWIPGKCDLWFQSHQIFHVLVVIATMVNYFGIRELAMYRIAQSASNPGFCNVMS